MWSPKEGRHVGLLGFLFGMLMLALLYFPWLGVYILVHLLYRDAQRAEYRADLLATRASGTEAMLLLFDQFLYSSGYEKAFKMFLWEPKTDFFAELPRQMAKVPPREVERQRRRDRLVRARMCRTRHRPIGSII